MAGKIVKDKESAHGNVWDGYALGAQPLDWSSLEPRIHACFVKGCHMRPYVDVHMSCVVGFLREVLSIDRTRLLTVTEHGQI